MDDLIIEFIAETNESIGELDSEIVRLEQNPDDIDLLNSIFRLMHTIKGTCGFLGLERLQKVAHAGENVLDKMRNRELAVTSAGVTLILECIDVIKGVLIALEETGAEPAGSDADVIARLNAYAEGGESAELVESEKSAADLAEEEALRQMQEGAVAEELVEQSGGADFNEDDFVPVPAYMTGAGEPQDAGTEAKKVAEEAAVAAAIQVAKKDKDADADEHKSGGKIAAPASIRVNVDTLEGLMQLVSELVLTRNQLMQLVRVNPDLSADYLAPFQRLSLITSDLQEGVMKTRMQPIGSAWSKLPRIIRDLSVELGKSIDLKMSGEDTELDRQMLELVKDPLTHMVRNSADHGIERPEVRRAAGKSETGTVHLSAFHEGGHIIVQIKDDGAGINPEVIARKAVEKGLATEAQVAQMEPRQIFQFIFAAGFSTAAQITSVSGRGVGMDVVRTNVEKMGGSIDLDSEVGAGTTFQMKIPLTLAIMPVLLMEAAGQKFAIPQINVVELVKAGGGSTTSMKIEHVNGSSVLRLRGRLLPLINLSETLGMREVNSSGDDGYIVVCELGAINYGLIVDKIFDTEEIVVKPVSAALRAITLYSGSTILGDGSVVMILDPNGLAKTINLRAAKQDNSQAEAKIADEDKPVTFLVFRAGDEAPKAVPLELVARLEEVEYGKIEHASGVDVLQYRGDLMRLTKLAEGYDYDRSSPEARNRVIVFANGKKVLGLAVEDILDIVDEKVDISMNSRGSVYFGSMVIDGKTTDIVDTSFLFEKMFSDWGGLDPNDVAKKSLGKVLLVEDSPFFRKLMVPALNSRGYEVKTAVNGLEAVGILQKQSDFNLIISDIDMPEMNGLEFAEACKGDPKLRHIPMIALTANTGEAVKDQAKKIGFIEYLSKTDREELFRSIIKILERQSEGVL